MDEFGEAIGVDPRSTRSDDEVAERVAAEQQQIQQQQQMEQMQQMAQMAQTAAHTPTGEGDENLLNDLNNVVSNNAT